MNDDGTQERLCQCLDRPLSFEHYTVVKHLGVDAAGGRFGEVQIKRCMHCGRLWLQYTVEYEHHSGSGRHFMGLLPPALVHSMTAEIALAYLESLEWHLFGGSYFGGMAKPAATPPVAVSL